MKKRTLGIRLTFAAAALVAFPATAGAKEPNCATTLGIANHGEHIVADYVAGIGRDNMAWPPADGIGVTVAANGGADTPGAPGPGSHFINGIAPGASFCIARSQSPGAHFGP